ncbi:hypothetical protein CUMW_142480 [Citrus unshiu]|nr:hypothetical protein CUMW_142480 [Citrus unshiu]
MRSCPAESGLPSQMKTNRVHEFRRFVIYIVHVYGHHELPLCYEVKCVSSVQNFTGIQLVANGKSLAACRTLQLLAEVCKIWVKAFVERTRRLLLSRCRVEADNDREYIKD